MTGPGYPPVTYQPAAGPVVPLLESLPARSLRAEFYDPSGARYGLPTYPFKWAPQGWLTRRQLRAEGLRPGGQPPAGQLLWRHRGRRRVAYLYLRSLALPVRPMTRGRERAIAAALCARMTCPRCQIWQPYCIPLSIGHCNNCAAEDLMKGPGK